GAWSVPVAAATEAGAAAVCHAAGAAFATPRTGYENQLVHGAAAGAPVWLADVRAGAGWQALDAR
ncbi:MAG: hypothetical protein JWN32_732, partial [Solirubrobacterales bacterium]|nr:hypothetical protein [Solirubrobacterales bacterium]